MAFPTQSVLNTDTYGVHVDRTNAHFADASQHNSPLSALSFGMVPSTTVDQGPALNSAIAAAASTSDSTFGRAVFIPQGWYRITTPIVPASNVLVFGEGSGTFLHWDSTGTMMTIASPTIQTKWTQIQFFGNAASFILVDINGSYAHNFTLCNFLGQHASTGTAKPNQWGVRMRNNVGDTFFDTCRFLNLGQAMQLDWVVGNSVDQTHFSECYKAIVASANNVASMVVTGSTFAVTSGGASESPFHIDIEGQAGEFYIDNCWFEGALKSIIVGRAGVGGPAGFGIMNSHLGSTTTNVELNSCRQPLIANCVLSNNGGVTNPAHIDVDPSVTEGVAINLVPHTGPTQIPLSDFPYGWLVFSRTAMRLPGNGVQIGDGASLFSGTGAPGSGLGTQGSLYLRTDGTTTSTALYIKTGASTWTAATLP